MRVGLFPGQGVPAKTVLETLPKRGDSLLDQADQTLGYELRRRVETIARRRGAALPTQLAQPAIFVAGLGAWERARESGDRCDYLAGHSLGEYTALVAGRALSFSHGLALVKVRSEAMEAAGKQTPGTMAAVLGLELEAVSDLAARSGVEVANDNAPGQLVLSGSEEGLAVAAGLVRAAGGRSVLLQVSGAFHTPAMASAGPALRDAIELVDIREPEIPVVSNVTARPYRDSGEIRALLVEQLTHRVRFRESLEWLHGAGVLEFDDLGPGQVVAGLAGRTFRGLQAPEVAAHA
jgi:[acyl-carrier-protein] S-malonyltransferase